MNFKRHDRKKIENKERKKFAKGFGPLSSQSDIPSRLPALSISKTDIRKSRFQNGKEFVSQLSSIALNFSSELRNENAFSHNQYIHLMYSFYDTFKNVKLFFLSNLRSLKNIYPKETSLSIILTSYFIFRYLCVLKNWAG